MTSTPLPNPDSPAFPTLAGGDVCGPGLTKREWLACELFARNHVRFGTCMAAAWREADAFFATDPQNRGRVELGDVVSFRVERAEALPDAPIPVDYAVEMGGNVEPTPLVDVVAELAKPSTELFPVADPGAFLSDEEDAALMAMGRAVFAEWEAKAQSNPTCPDMPLGAAWKSSTWPDGICVNIDMDAGCRTCFDGRLDDDSRALLRRVQRERDAQEAGRHG